MSAFEWALAACVCVVVWLLICAAHRIDAQYANERYSICSECNGDCLDGESLCTACRKVARARELKEKE